MLNMDCSVLISDPAFLIYTDLNELPLGWIFVRVVHWPRSLVSESLSLSETHFILLNILTEVLKA